MVIGVIVLRGRNFTEVSRYMTVCPGASTGHPRAPCCP